MPQLLTFVTESNKIERIYEIRREELIAHSLFILLPEITIQDLEDFVSVVQPDAKFRLEYSMNVQIGNYIPPGGGPYVVQSLKQLLSNMSKMTPFIFHRHYEQLHPFTDGNGRSGRALWLWHCQKQEPSDFKFALEYGFLHTYYYQSLKVFE